MDQQLKQKIKKASSLLKSLSNESRLLILCQLTEGEKSVGELLENSHLSQSAFSQHLSKLRNEGIVETRKKSQMVYYRISKKDVFEVIEALHNIYCN